MVPVFSCYPGTYIGCTGIWAPWNRPSPKAIDVVWVLEVCSHYWSADTDPMDVFTVGAVSVPLPLAGFTTYNLGVFDTRAVDQ